ncbi:hypothetical protein [Cyclobacterium plantarum]|uniref:DUF4239 domain-containing protein n=1 Tax=Cyclobacterium plantarum TaxID=2716263 RepID=A0ABX0HAE1_9BACT|nr:hypothetical protein [Cyclobacterium plantarum]NHE57863.1 hypothetical protein [Cyclobacterium plantarum]
MFGSVILEVVIGLIFIYLLLSLLATTVSELAMNLIYSRGKNLHLALQTMLDDEEDVLCKKFFDHPLIQKLKKKGDKGFPSYIRNEYFSKVLIELLYKDNDGQLENIEAAINDLPDGKTKEVLQTFARDARGNIETFKENIEKWYQEVMDQATGWYKVNVRKVLFVLGLIISIVFNADTIRMAEKISNDPEARQQIVAMAYEYMEKEEGLNSTTSNEPDSNLVQLRAKIYDLIDEEIETTTSVLGMGWNDAPRANIRFFSNLWPDIAWWSYVLYSLLGWIITAFAITLGAPFWFDLLKRVMSIRASGEKPADKK